jgi:3-oxoacyl-[acyl-carrier protein] reductase
MNIDLKNKTYIITGGSRGIGKAVVEQLATSGANVFFTYNKSKNEAEDLAHSLNTLRKGKILTGHLDISKGEAVDQFIEIVGKELGDINGLVNNAGITSDKSLTFMEADSWHSVIDTNLNSLYYLTRAVVKKMIFQGEGKIVNISSVAGIKGSVGQTNYSAAKAGIIGFTKSLALELARFNIQANVVAPGLIDTNMVELMNEKQVKKITSQIPLNRAGTPEEVSNAILFLLSSASNYITGHTLVIDGGLSI